MPQPDGWRVVRQDPTERYNGRSFEQGVIVEIVTDSGTRKELWIPEQFYNPDYIIAAGNAFAEQERRIMALGNE